MWCGAKSSTLDLFKFGFLFLFFFSFFRSLVDARLIQILFCANHDLILKFNALYCLLVEVIWFAWSPFLSFFERAVSDGNVNGDDERVFYHIHEPLKFWVCTLQYSLHFSIFVHIAFSFFILSVYSFSPITALIVHWSQSVLSEFLFKWAYILWFQCLLCEISTTVEVV